MTENTDKEPIVTFEDALQIILDSVIPITESEIVSIIDAAGRVLAEDIQSTVNIPPYDNSAMDGYAVIAGDSTSASVDNPAILQIIDEIKAGGDFAGKRVTPGTAIRIMTGAPVPEGANAVIMFEDTQEEQEEVRIFKGVKESRNIRRAGEDVSIGSIALEKGTKLKSSDIGLLASLNKESVPVIRKPRAAIITTGDEIAELGEKITEGQIRNSNAYTLLSEVKKYHSIPVYLGNARDTVKDTREKLTRGLQYDIIITTGGVSMGKYDFVKEVIHDIGIQVLFEKIRMKPGKPCIFGRKDNTLFFGLPGNPVSTMVSFLQFVRPALLTLMGSSKIAKPVLTAILKEDIRKKVGRKNLLRGFFSIKDGTLFVSTTGPQGSGILRSMSQANCIIIVPLEVDRIPAGDKVSIQLIDHEEI